MTVDLLAGDGLELAVEQRRWSKTSWIVVSKGQTSMKTFWKGKNYLAAKNLGKSLAA